MPEMIVVLLLATPLLAALACVLPAFTAERAALSRTAALLILLFVFLLAAQTSRPGARLGLGGLVLIDPATAIVLLAVSIPAAAGILFSPTLSARHSAARPQPWGTIHLLIAALLCAAVTAHAFLLVLSLAASVLLIGGLAGGSEARRGLLPCVLGLAVALAALLCLAVPAGGDGWTALQRGAQASHTLARLAFVLSLLGFGGVAGLVAPWSWLPAAGRRTPAPAAPLVLVGLPICALQAILRWAALTGHAVGSVYPARLLLGTGLLAMAALLPALLAERDARRLPALAGGAQAALIAAAWGLNSRAAAGGGMLVVICWSLAASAALPAMAVVRERRGAERLLRLGALPAGPPVAVAAALGGLLAYGWWAPSGAFLALISVLEAATRRSLPVELVFLVFAAPVMLAVAGQTARLARGWRGRVAWPTGRVVAARADRAVNPWQLLIPLGALLLLGIHVPDGLANLMTQAATTIGGGP